MPHQPGEFDGGLAVGVDGSVLVELQVHLHLAFGQLNLFHPAHGHTRHLDRVAHLEVLDIVELGAQMVARFENIPAAEDE